jgi:hypothetical protein
MACRLREKRICHVGTQIVAIDGHYHVCILPNSSQLQHRGISHTWAHSHVHNVFWRSSSSIELLGDLDVNKLNLPFALISLSFILSSSSPYYNTDRNMITILPNTLCLSTTQAAVFPPNPPPALYVSALFRQKTYREKRPNKAARKLPKCLSNYSSCHELDMI